jgi:hypothetical protein
MTWRTLSACRDDTSVVAPGVARLARELRSRGGRLTAGCGHDWPPHGENAETRAPGVARLGRAGLACATSGGGK